jgi:hypothetical protein
VLSSHLSRAALEGEVSNPNRNSLGNIAIEIDEVVGLAINGNSPVVLPGGLEEALSRVVGVDELSRCCDVGGADSSALEEILKVAGHVVGRDRDVRVDAGLIIEDAESDLADSGEGSDARGKSQDSRCKNGGELHFDGLVWCWGLFVVVVNVVRRQEIEGIKGRDEETVVWFCGCRCDDGS